MTTRLSTKGQLIIPKEIRERHGWSSGTELQIEDRGDYVAIRPVAEEPEVTLEDLVGCAGYRGPAKSLQDMDDVARSAQGVEGPRIELLSGGS